MLLKFRSLLHIIHLYKVSIIVQIFSWVTVRKSNLKPLPFRIRLSGRWQNGAKAEKNGKQADASVQRLEQEKDRCTINLLHVVCTKSLTRQLVEFMECLSARRDPYDLYYDYEAVGARKGCFSVNVKTATRSDCVACFRNCSTHAECAKNFYSFPRTSCSPSQASQPPPPRTRQVKSLFSRGHVADPGVFIAMFYKQRSSIHGSLYGVAITTTM